MSKSKTPAKKPKGKVDTLKGLKAKKVPKSNGKTDEPLSSFKTGGLTTDELKEKLDRNLVIRYVGIDDETNFLILNADDNNKSLPKEIEKDTFKAPVHKKLKAALQKFRVHAAIMAGYIKASSYKKLSDIPAELYANFNVTSVHFKYPKTGDSIQINATLTTERKKAFNFTTPIEKLESDSELSYEFPDDLLKIRQNIFDRVDAYMSGEERGDSNAVGMFAEVEETKIEVPADHLDEHSEDEVR